MRLRSSFDEFLRAYVNIDQSRLDALQQHVEAIETFVKGHHALGPRFIRTIPQGSWAHRTIIRPQPDQEFDADLLLQLKSDSAWAPAEYLSATVRAFRGSGIYGPKTKLKARCVRIQYAGDHHVDVVPFVVAEGVGNIINKDEFERTDPEAYSKWLKLRDNLTSGDLRRVIRLLKYVRDYNDDFSVRSIILTTLIAERVSPESFEKSPDCYADVPTTLRTVMTDLAAYLDQHASPPSVADPSGPGRTFDHRWDAKTYPQFRERILYYAEKVVEAYDQADQERSVALWQDIFGPDFKTVSGSATKAMSQVSQNVQRSREPGEEFLDEKFNVPRVAAGDYELVLKCDVKAPDGFRSGDLATLQRVPKHCKLTFRITRCAVREPFDVYWKIKNSGEEARTRGQLRGEVVPDKGLRTRDESTAYRGKHYVECYVVKDGKCIAQTRRDVVVV